MAHVSTLMGQLLQLIPRHVFDQLVDSHAWQGPKPRKFTYWSHLAAMLFGQWSARKSLRDVVFSVNRQARNFTSACPSHKRSTLADANQQRPAIIFEKTYYRLYERVSAELAPGPKRLRRSKSSMPPPLTCARRCFPGPNFGSARGPLSCIPSSLACCPSVSWSPTAKPMTSKPSKICAFSRAISSSLTGPTWIMPGFINCTKAPSGL